MNRMGLEVKPRSDPCPFPIVCVLHSLEEVDSIESTLKSSSSLVSSAQEVRLGLNLILYDIKVHIVPEKKIFFKGLT